MKETEIDELPNLTEQFLRNTSLKVHEPIWVIKWILKAAGRLLSRSAALGRPPVTPIGYCAILVISDIYASNERNIRHSAFQGKVLIPYLFDDDMLDWGYEFIPATTMKRALRLSLRKNRTFDKITAENGNGALIYHYSRRNTTV